MRLRVFICALVVSVSTIFSSGCQVDELIFYEHEPSKIFYEKLEIDAPELKPYITDGILLVVSLKAMNYNEYIVWLGLYSSGINKQVSVNKAIIGGDNWNLETSFDERIILDEGFDRAKYYQNSIKLFQIENHVLEQAYKNGSEIRLKVYYEINNEEFRNDYKLVRRVEKYVVYPT